MNSEEGVEQVSPEEVLEQVLVEQIEIEQINSEEVAEQGVVDQGLPEVVVEHVVVEQVGVEQMNSEEVVEQGVVDQVVPEVEEEQVGVENVPSGEVTVKQVVVEHITPEEIAEQSVEEKVAGSAQVTGSSRDQEYNLDHSTREETHLVVSDNEGVHDSSNEYQEIMSENDSLEMMITSIRSNIGVSYINGVDVNEVCNSVDLIIEQDPSNPNSESRYRYILQAGGFKNPMVVNEGNSTNKETSIIKDTSDLKNNTEEVEEVIREKYIENGCVGVVEKCCGDYKGNNVRDNKETPVDDEDMDGENIEFLDSVALVAGRAIADLEETVKSGVSEATSYVFGVAQAGVFRFTSNLMNSVTSVDESAAEKRPDGNPIQDHQRSESSAYKADDERSDIDSNLPKTIIVEQNSLPSNTEVENSLEYVPTVQTGELQLETEDKCNRDDIYIKNEIVNVNNALHLSETPIQTEMADNKGNPTELENTSHDQITRIRSADQDTNIIHSHHLTNENTTHTHSDANRMHSLETMSLDTESRQGLNQGLCFQIDELSVPKTTTESVEDGIIVKELADDGIDGNGVVGINWSMAGDAEATFKLDAFGVTSKRGERNVGDSKGDYAGDIASYSDGDSDTDDVSEAYARQAYKQEFADRIRNNRQRSSNTAPSKQDTGREISGNFNAKNYLVANDPDPFEPHYGMTYSSDSDPNSVSSRNSGDQGGEQRSRGSDSEEFVSVLSSRAEQEDLADITLAMDWSGFNADECASQAGIQIPPRTLKTGVGESTDSTSTYKLSSPQESLDCEVEMENIVDEIDNYLSRYKFNVDNDLVRGDEEVEDETGDVQQDLARDSEIMGASTRRPEGNSDYNEDDSKTSQLGELDLPAINESSDVAENKRKKLYSYLNTRKNKKELDNAVDKVVSGIAVMNSTDNRSGQGSAGFNHVYKNIPDGKRHSATVNAASIGSIGYSAPEVNQGEGSNVKKTLRKEPTPPKKTLASRNLGENRRRQTVTAKRRVHTKRVHHSS